MKNIIPHASLYQKTSQPGKAFEEEQKLQSLYEELDMLRMEL